MQDVLPDVLVPGLKVVFCGNAAGTVSARKGAPYAGPGNYFWRALHEVGLEAYDLERVERSVRRFAPELLAAAVDAQERVA